MFMGKPLDGGTISRTTVLGKSALVGRRGGGILIRTLPSLGDPELEVSRSGHGKRRPASRVDSILT